MFPAPSGIVDYALRTPGNGANISVLSEGNSFCYYTVQLDGRVPLDDTLSVGGGIGVNRNMSAGGTDNYEGEIGVLVKWTPLPNLEILPFWSRKDTYVQKDGEAYEPLTDFLPSPVPARHFFGPKWALGQDFSFNDGTLVNYTLSLWVILGNWDCPRLSAAKNLNRPRAGTAG